MGRYKLNQNRFSQHPFSIYTREMYIGIEKNGQKADIILQMNLIYTLTVWLFIILYGQNILSKYCISYVQQRLYIYLYIQLKKDLKRILSSQKASRYYIYTKSAYNSEN